MFRSIASIAVAGLLLVGCGTGISQEALEANGLEGAPSWVTANNGDYTAVATAPIVDGDIDFARNEAADSARAKLAKEVQSKVEYASNSDKKRNGRSTNQEVTQKAKAIASQVLNGTHEVTWWMNTKTVAVLVELPKHFVQELRKELKGIGIDYDAAEQRIQGAQNITAQQSQANEKSKPSSTEEEW